MHLPPVRLPPLALALGAAVGLLSAPAAVRAGGGAFLTIQSDTVTLPGEQPVLVMVPEDDVARVEVRLVRGDGVVKTLTAQNIPGGSEKSFTWAQPEGRFEYAVTAKATFRDRTTWEGEDSYTITAATLLKGDIPVETVDPSARSFEIRTSRPASRVDVSVVGEDLSEVAKATVPLPGQKGTPQTVTWPETEARVFKVIARAYDEWGFWTEAEINLWSLEIPHEEVVFPTNSYQVLADEAPKLDRAYRLIDEAVVKYGDLVQVRLFIAGYTDTVGDPGSNQGLSENRARSIASYFRTKGFKFPIFFQGFGESVLAVPTDDGVDMHANRRALYVLAASFPGRTKDLPRANWKRLP
ncbi:OmpA family protein [Myxococcota bacterium]|nr:OmpA family protein [Myxococcota bacterium]